MVKSRFRLLQTEIKLLADNVRNNPDYDEVALKSAIKAIEKTFNELFISDCSPIILLE